MSCTNVHCSCGCERFTEVMKVWRSLRTRADRVEAVRIVGSSFTTDAAGLVVSDDDNLLQRLHLKLSQPDTHSAQLTNHPDS